MICDLAAPLIEAYAEQAEQRAAVTGVTDGGNALVILATPDRSRWTVLVIKPDGAACVVQTGSSLDMPAPQPGSPS